MTTQRLCRFALMAIMVIACAGAPAAFAQRGGGGHGGGFHGGGGFHSGGFHGGGFHGGGFHGDGFHGGGFRGRPRFGGGYYRGGGWGGRGGWGGYGSGLGWLGYGLAFSTLPLYYNTYWWDGVPYYYADDNYYQWDGDLNEYETVQPPAGLAQQVAASPPAQDPSVELYAYPRNGQSVTQQARDRDECRKWASGQTGTEPAKHGDYLKAEEACLTARGYSVR